MIILYLELVGIRSASDYFLFGVGGSGRLFLIWSRRECGDYSLFGVGGSAVIIPY